MGEQTFPIILIKSSLSHVDWQHCDSQRRAKLQLYFPSSLYAEQRQIHFGTMCTFVCTFEDHPRFLKLILNFVAPSIVGTEQCDVKKTVQFCSTSGSAKVNSLCWMTQEHFPCLSQSSSSVILLPFLWYVSFPSHHHLQCTVVSSALDKEIMLCVWSEQTDDTASCLVPTGRHGNLLASPTPVESNSSLQGPPTRHICGLTFRF